MVTIKIIMRIIKERKEGNGIKETPRTFNPGGLSYKLIKEEIVLFKLFNNRC